MRIRILVGAVLCGLLLLADVQLPASRSHVWRNLSPWAWLFHGVVAEATFTPTPVKSITDIVVTLGPGAGSVSQTVAVRRLSSLLVYSGQTHDCGIQASSAWALGYISSDTTVTVQRGAGDCTVVYTAQLVEYLPNFIRSQQCGSIQMVAAQSTGSAATGTTIVPAKTILAHTGIVTDMSSAVQSQPAADQFVRLTKAATTITANRATTTTRNTTTVGYCYVELP